MLQLSSESCPTHRHLALPIEPSLQHLSIDLVWILMVVLNDCIHFVTIFIFENEGSKFIVFSTDSFNDIDSSSTDGEAHELKKSGAISTTCKGKWCADKTITLLHNVSLLACTGNV